MIEWYRHQVISSIGDSVDSNTRFPPKPVGYEYSEHLHGFKSYLWRGFI